MNPFVLSLGSNLDYAEANANLSRAEMFLSEYFDGEIVFSPHYQTEGVGSGKGKMYVNAVAKGKTLKEYSEIQKTLKEIEMEMGRTPETKALGIVPIDLDLLSLGEEIFRPKDLEQNYVKRGLDSLQ